jgi:hypothetical protein
MSNLTDKLPTLSIQVDVSLETFLDEWPDEPGIEPTQQDYDDWAISTVMGWLEWRQRGGGLQDHLSLLPLDNN